jgi:hypothetical protein
MTYYHWASAPVTLRMMNYQQMGHPKPNGLWFDVNGSWKQWCEAVQFRTEALCFRHTVTILDTSRILFLKNARDIDTFTRRFGHDFTGNIEPLQTPEELDNFAGQYGKDLFQDVLGQFVNYIMWGEVAQEYSGIIISPYLREQSETYLWYYGWNCAGGCIWDTNIVSLGKPQIMKD